MTDKKEKILHAALELFANDGYNATSTSKIAKGAGVSEGLIFRHFGHKKGLLDAIMAYAEKKIGALIAPILSEAEPKAVLRKSIELPFSVNEEEYDFWKLQFKLKWEKDYYHPDKMKPLLEKLTWAFTALKYTNPEKEAVLLNQVVDAIAINILRDGLESQQAYRSFLLEKYLG